MPQEPLLRFGVELEFILAPKELTPGMSRHDLACRIAEHHNAIFQQSGDLKMHALDPTAGTGMKSKILMEKGYTEWELTDDCSIWTRDDQRCA